MHGFINENCKHLDTPVLAISGMQDHIHILMILSKNHSLVSIVQERNKRSSKWIKEQPGISPHFYWQNGYGAFSVSPRHVETVKRYIANQKEHHKDTSYKEEYVAFLNDYNVDYDERYVWE